MAGDRDLHNAERLIPDNHRAAALLSNPLEIKTHNGTNIATAMAAMPSLRPTKPMVSLVVALMPTRAESS